MKTQEMFVDVNGIGHAKIEDCVEINLSDLVGVVGSRGVRALSLASSGKIDQFIETLIWVRDFCPRAKGVRYSDRELGA